MFFFGNHYVVVRQGDIHRNDLKHFVKTLGCQGKKNTQGCKDLALLTIEWGKC